MWPSDIIMRTALAQIHNEAVRKGEKYRRTPKSQSSGSKMARCGLNDQQIICDLLMICGLWRCVIMDNSQVVPSAMQYAHVGWQSGVMFFFMSQYGHFDDNYPHTGREKSFWCLILGCPYLGSPLDYTSSLHQESCKELASAEFDSPGDLHCLILVSFYPYAYICGSSCQLTVRLMQLFQHQAWQIQASATSMSSELLYEKRSF